MRTTIDDTMKETDDVNDATLQFRNRMIKDSLRFVKKASKNRKVQISFKDQRCEGEECQLSLTGREFKSVLSLSNVPLRSQLGIAREQIPLFWNTMRTHLLTGSRLTLWGMIGSDTSSGKGVPYHFEIAVTKHTCCFVRLFPVHE